MVVRPALLASLRRRLESPLQRELLACAVVAAVLVVCRAVVPLRYEQLFDSDQAIVGLMAKHLSEFRTFPLFFYGQHYMLGVQSWIAVPFFWIGGPTVAMLRLPLVIVNIIVAVLFIVSFARCGLRPVHGLVAALPIVVTTPVMSVELLATIGASIEPFAYVALLWALRTRPVAFGTVLCLGSLHREFTMFALPAIVVAEWRGWRSWSAARWAKGAGAFAAAWLLVDVLKRQVNVFGPSGGLDTTGSAALGTKTILRWLSFQWDPYAARLRELVTWGLPDMYGIRPYPLNYYGLPTTLRVGSMIAAVALVGAAGVSLYRMAWLARRTEVRRRGGDDGVRFCVYMALIGLQTILAYGLNGGIAVGMPPVLRYAMFALLLPVALLGLYFQIETSRRWRAGIAVAIAVWATCNVVDNVRLVRDFAAAPPPRHRRVMADYLVAHGIKYGRAQYWDAYSIVFLSRERVILASTEKIRISAYEAQVEAHPSTAVTLRREPCNDGIRVAAWCLVEPGAR